MNSRMSGHESQEDQDKSRDPSPSDSQFEKTALIEHDAGSDQALQHDGNRRASTTSSQDHQQHRQSRRGRLQGWRSGVLIAALVAVLILAFNIFLVVWSTFTYGTSHGLGVGYEGDCTTAGRWVLGFKVIINVFSTILLSFSNYAMQCLSSPTRKDLDRAHTLGHWMDIAVPGVRNLSRIGWTRIILWAFLALSSIPIHLLYNSTVFKTLEAEMYTVVAVHPEFLNATGFNDYYWLGNPSNGTIPRPMNSSQIASVSAIQDSYIANQTMFQYMNNEDCIKAYAQPTVWGRSNLILVLNATSNSSTTTTTTTTTNESLVYWNTINSFSRYDLPYKWICHDLSDTDSEDGPSNCNAFNAQKHATNWTIDAQPINHCLSQQVPPHCKLQFSTYLMGAVIACNAIKILCMLCTAWQHKDEIIVTLGDALASYLDHPDDSNTPARCLMGWDDLKHNPGYWIPTASYPPAPKRAEQLATRRWFVAASLQRWALAVAVFLAGILAVAVFLVIAAASFAANGGSEASLWQVGFGDVDSRTLIGGYLPRSGAAGVTASILVANLPQLVLSLIYLAYNGILTSMLLEKEWSDFAVLRRPLRVSTPRGEQKSSRWLTLPYRYSLPLLAISIGMHLLVSNSLFLVSISIYNNGRVIDNGDIAQLGWSPIPMLCVIVIGFCMLVTPLGISAKKLKGNMPLLRSCSLVISAACHRPKDDGQASVKAVQWGEVMVPDDEGKGSPDVGHCCFTSQDVSPIVSNRQYAG